ncbi:choice-of-anchor J domain-containing protein, partial [Myroides guanonis]
MKLKLTTIFLALTMLCGYWLFAHQKLQTFSFGDFISEIISPSKDAFNETLDASLALATGEIFNDDFETPQTWSLINSDVNKWYVGTAVPNGGSKSLYISDDNGVTNNYSESVLDEDVSLAISPAFSVPVGAKDYIVSFDWRSKGEGSDWSVSDALSVWLIPETFSPPKGLRINSGSGGLLLNSDMFDQSTFKKEFIKVDLSKFAGTKMKIVFQWASNMWTQNQTPAAIDNVSIYKETCLEPKGLAVKDIELDEATVNWTAPNSSITDFELFIGKDQKYPTGTTGVIPAKGVTTYTFLNLDASTYYYVWYRSVCSTSDKSYWEGPVKFMTKCGVFPTPFYETFDTNSLNIECWTLVQNNPSDTDSFELSTNYRMEGDRGLMFQCYSGNISHDSYAITPAFDFNGGLYKLTYYYKTSPSGNNEFEVLLSKNGIDVKEFTTTLVAKKIYQKSEYVQETVFINGITGVVNIAWHINSVGSSTFHIDNVSLESVGCTEPLRVSVTDIATDSAKFLWDDDIATEWEYLIIDSSIGAPTTSGTKVSKTEVVGLKDVSGNNLLPDTEYGFFVRSKCLDGTFGDWIGPLIFKTACLPKVVPYKEGFNTIESDLDCWTIIDTNIDGTPYGDIWKQSEWTVYEGDRCMYYSGSSPVNDDWLISPGFNLTGGLYAVTFYYQIDQNTTANVEVKLSTSGIDPSAFTQTIGTTLVYKGAFYTKKVVYVDGVTGVANIGFHVTGTSGQLQIDKFSIEKVTCRAPEDIVTTKIGTTSVDISWVDPTNTSWEYYVMPDDGLTTPPLGTGTLAKSNNPTLTNTNSPSAPLKPNTEYKVYVRSSCGEGKTSEWVGPIVFRTECEIMPIPYQEGFNSNTDTQYCWKIVDGNNDAPWYGGFGEWFTTDQQAYEGDKSMYFTNFDSTNDDWLMSPLFKFEKNKIYRVTFMHRTEPGIKSEFGVRLSKTGRDKEKFTQILLPNTVFENVPWKKHKFLLSGIEGEVSIAFYVTDFNEWGSGTYIDDFRIEEVTTCTEPLTQGAENITGTSADIFWDNDFGTTNWEYFVRKKAFLIAPPLKDGTATSKNKVNVTKDNFGANLEGNTWYEFYVRTKCGDGSKTEWTGPYYFRTGCTYSTLPFWEGFNGNDNSLPCWSMVNGNTGASLWKQSTSNLYEGSHSISYVQSGAADSNDWFISPLFKNLDATKTYRVKFNYKGTGSGNNEMEVLASTKGTSLADFTQTIAPKMSYKSATFKDGIYFFTGISGDMHLAFRVSGIGAKNITIDNLFIDEVTTCGQPLNLGAKDILGTSVNLMWDDAFGATAWQYMIQETKQIAPTDKDAGIPTTSKDFVADKDINGKALVSNTDYVYYVRTDCGNGTFSEWSGPFAFVTACDIYTVPFTAGFNSDSKQIRCWSIKNGAGSTTKWTANTTWPFEGDGLMQFNQTSATAQADGYLISPTIAFASSTNYVLKYRYKTNPKTLNEFEVLLSTTGADISNFTTTLLSKKAYTNANYLEEVIYISGVSGNVNIAWHTMTKGAMTIGLDYVTIERATSCPEPSNVTVTDYTTNTIDVEWTQSGGITSWEVYVVEYGTPIPTGTSGVVVTGTPKYKATGLTSGKSYHIYVRAKCPGGTDMSNWSTPANGPTKVTTNGGCAGAITIPVNSGADCVRKLGVSSVGAPEISTPAKPNPFPNCMDFQHETELWFEFTATSSSHLLSFDNIINVDKLESPSIAYQVFSGNCSNIFTSFVDCYQFDSSYGNPSKDDTASTISGLIPGNKYYVRIGLPKGNFLFTMCISTSEYNYVTVSKNGDKYTTEELVKEVLIQSDCDLVSNVVYKTGPNLGGKSLGYFNKNGSTFPFEEGIVLATHDIATTPGPYYDYGDAGGPAGVRGMIPAWEGDEDLNNVIASVGGDVWAGTKSVSTLEFDFVPIKDTIRFDYLLASESYLHTCTVVCWGGGALFTAWLSEIETGQGQNLALVPGTNQPISLSTVRDTDISGADCNNVNPEYFGKYYGNGHDDPITAPINYIGMTIPMSSEPTAVKPGVKYRIKFAMVDYCNTNHVSAVFFNARSFDLGGLDLGADLLIKDNTAICDSQSKTIDSGLSPNNVKISWYKDDELIVGEDKPSLEVSESGVYKAVGFYEEVKCEISGSIVVEMFPPLSDKIKSPAALILCSHSLEEQYVNLTDVEIGMFKGLDKTNYEISYHNTEQDANDALNAIETTDHYLIESSASTIKKFIRVVDLTTGCYGVFEMSIRFEVGQVPTKPNDVDVCSQYT